MTNETRVERASNPVSGLFVFVIMGVFAMLALLIVVLGAQVYQRIIDRGETSAGMRIALSYVANKVRGMDADGAIEVTEIGGIPVLILQETVDDELLLTHIYHYEGELKEQYGYAGDEFELEFGDTLTRLDDFSIRQEGPMIYLSAQIEDEHCDLQLGLRTAP